MRLQSQHIRSFLAKEIEEFENSFEEILQTASVFLVTTERVAQSPSLVIIDQASVVKTVCHFLASSNAILEFLDFQHRRTGLASGGDPSLEQQVKDAQILVQELLNTFILHKKAEHYPGKEMGFIYNEDVMIYGSFLLHRFHHTEQSEIPDPDDDNVDVGKLVRYWHTDSLFSPLRHVPGTPWHKFFGNLRPGPLARPALFRERKPLPFFHAIIPPTIEWLHIELEDEYEKYRDMFERFRRLPGPRLPDSARIAMIRDIQRRLSHLFRGWKRAEEASILSLEDMTDFPCPEYDLLGLSKFEALNAEINATDMAGIALLGEPVAPVPVILEAQIRRYCLEFDGEWDTDFS
ncbi:hypothetical protein N657DRAFT_643898 [Parathielavia appendiculata]|uniref:Uncharacterized protein n=1 Tax=Parathielavia appendiculata TaxID=2587402 RepID=A0AAN6U2A2_9PEZI|nr:hypothetical protein N657DRAFT_643898 [Parathielavia appendiculata]